MEIMRIFRLCRIKYEWKKWASHLLNNLSTWKMSSDFNGIRTHDLCDAGSVHIIIFRWTLWDNCFNSASARSHLFNSQPFPSEQNMLASQTKWEHIEEAKQPTNCRSSRRTHWQTKSNISLGEKKKVQNSAGSKRKSTSYDNMIRIWSCWVYKHTISKGLDRVCKLHSNWSHHEILRDSIPKPEKHFCGYNGSKTVKKMHK